MFRRKSLEPNNSWRWPTVLQIAQDKTKLGSQQRQGLAEELLQTLLSNDFAIRDIDLPPEIMKRENTTAHRNVVPAPFPDILEDDERIQDFWLRVYHNITEMLASNSPRYKISRDEIVNYLQRIFPGILGLGQLSQLGLKTLQKISIYNLNDIFLRDQQPSLQNRPNSDLFNFDPNHNNGNGNGFGSKRITNIGKENTSTTGAFAELPVSDQARILAVCRRLLEDNFTVSATIAEP